MTEVELQELVAKVEGLEDRVHDLETELSSLKHEMEHPMGYCCTSCD